MASLVPLRHRIKLSYNRLVLRDPRARFALRVGIYSGLCAMLLDLDHITLFFGHPDGRVLHTPLAIVAFFVAGYFISRIGGLLARLVLRKIKNRPKSSDPAK